MLKNRKKGITLIALVITIVILLILAGISISALTNTGIFGKVEEAKRTTENEEKEQREILSEYEKELNKYEARNLTNDMIGQVMTQNTVFKDSKGNIFVVPIGFKITNDATNVADGIVIEDATETATKGSQFVWVPVGTITKTDGTTVEIKLSRYTFANDDNATPTIQNENVIESFFQELESSNKKNIVAKSISDFKTSVTINEGYYIGRYEARTTIARNNKDNELTQITEKGTDVVYNYVTQGQAAEQARNMYNNSNFTSDLINSYAWDTAIVFIQKCGTESNSSTYSKTVGQSSTSTSATQTTGTNKLKATSKVDKQCNIFDMAGNCYEWTTETYLSSCTCVGRGGGYGDSYGYTSRRDTYDTDYAWNDYSFRPLLYL